MTPTDQTPIPDALPDPPDPSPDQGWTVIATAPFGQLPPIPLQPPPINLGGV